MGRAMPRLCAGGCGDGAWRHRAVSGAEGRRYLLHGFTHAGSPEQHGVIEDAQTGEFVTVPLEQVELVAAEE